MIDFRKLGEFCARHGCAEKYLRNVERMPRGYNYEAFYTAFFWPKSEMKYWGKIHDLWMQELKE